MIASVFNVRPGHVRGGVSTSTLRRLLRGEQSFEDALTDGGNKPARYVHFSHVRPETVVGFVPYPEHPREIIVVRLPFAQQVVPAVILRPAEQDWEPSLQLLSKEYLLRHEAIAIKADWLNHLINLAGTLENPKARAFGVDKTPLAIGAAWERWEHDGLTWEQRCIDLARLTGAMGLKPNTLLRKCARLGLFHGDNKGHSVSATRRH